MTRSLCALLLAVAAWPTPLLAADPTYWQDVRPILRKNCTVCHSAKHLDEVDVSGGLALDSYEGVLKGSKTAVIHARKSEASRLVERLTTRDEDKRMPQGATPLSPETIELIRRWIDAGAREGSRPASAAPPVETRHLAPTRKLDVTLMTEAIPPRGVLGPAAPGKLELSLKVGPLAPVAAVVFSPDGRLLAVGSYGQVTIWDLAAARPAKVLTNVLGAVNDLRFSPDGKLLAVAGGQPSARGDLRLYQTSDWKLLGTLAGHGDVIFSVSFAPDGKHLASASFDKTVRIWDLATRKLQRTLAGHSDFVYAVAYSPDGKWLVSASKDRTIKLVEAKTGKSRLTFSGMNEEVLAVAVSADGKSVVSSGLEPALSWWNPQTGERVRTQGGHGVAVHEICFSKDGKLLASAGGDGTVRLWNGANGSPVRTFVVGSVVYAASLGPDGKRVAAGGFDGFVRVWDVASGRLLLTLLALPASGTEASRERERPEGSEWLALTPEGYNASSSGLVRLGEWRMAGRTVAAQPVWAALGQPAVVARAIRGEKVPPPTFGKR
jgi:WD40 repeat protein